MPARTSVPAPSPPTPSTPATAPAQSLSANPGPSPDASPDASSNLWSSLTLAAADIKLSHSIFALPFAVLGAFAARDAAGPWPRFAAQLALIVACMVMARTWAMLFNRLADAGFDAANPRTTRRAIASGRLSRARGWALALTAAAGFVLCCALFLMLYGNPWPLTLSLPVLAWLAFYSLAKRFTALCHLLLGTALAISPIAAGLAVDPSRALTTTHLLLAGFVTLWVAGFDVLYALQDESFDRQRGLHSIPALLGPRASAWCARLMHLGASCALLLLGLGPSGPLGPHADARLGTLTLIAWALATALLIAEHAVLVRRGLAGLPMAFFTINGVLSLVVGALGVTDLLVN